MTEMSARQTISEFLEARIAEDEVVARSAAASSAEERDNDEALLAWSADRALAEAASKRAAIGSGSPLAPVAAVYAAHPDYDPNWAN